MKSFAAKRIFILLISACFSVCSADSGPAYQTSLFDTGRVYTVDVQISDAGWEDLLPRPGADHYQKVSQWYQVQLTHW